MTAPASGAPPFRRILIANRGEIAVRVIQACRALGIESVAVHSDADAGARHVRLADRAIRLGPAAAAESYLVTTRVLDAARHAAVDAVHPGYGFLSENAAFAEACATAGFVFIGPPAGAIDRMGSKINARLAAEHAGVPVVPGETPAAQDDDSIAHAARRLGFPVLLKPSAGGGGIGMTTVDDESALGPAIASARREAAAAFGDGTLYVERLIDRPRHVEIQILADAHGGVVHLFERECSLQRRHQKVLEESPSPALTPALRSRMGDAAVRIAREVGYRNAGTVEFLLEGTGEDARFYFLEMNTRLQVEHPVTEAVTGLDLVAAQIRIAAGQPLPWSQEGLTQRGHAIEARVYAEDPARGDLPQAGPLLLYREPRGPGVRVDSGYEQGDAISVHYDPLIAKVIVQAETRSAALDRLDAALRDYPILGVRTNLPLLRALAAEPAVRHGVLDTGFLAREATRLRASLDREVPPAVRAVAETHRAATAPARGVAAPDPWATLGSRSV